MKVVIQGVKKASVSIDGEIAGAIGQGLVVLAGVAEGDTPEDISYIAQKTIDLRIFEDTGGKLNLSIKDIKGELLLVSQFTLLANTRKGRRPGFTDAAPPDVAEELFDQFVYEVRTGGLKVETARFRTDMLVEIHNDGPVTIIIDSRERLNPRD